MARVYETMRRAEVGRTYVADEEGPWFVIRLWLDGHDLAYADHALAVARDLALKQKTTFEAAQSIADHVPHLNAVEVVDRDGGGSVIYTDWPDEGPPEPQRHAPRWLRELDNISAAELARRDRSADARWSAARRCPKCCSPRQERIAGLWLCQACGHEWGSKGDDR